MKSRNLSQWVLVAFVIAGLSAPAFAESQPAPSTADQLASLQGMCSDSEAARAQRQAEKGLYFRLGEYEGIEDLSREIIRLHDENEQIKHLLYSVDRDKLVKHLSDFVASGTGGTQTYSGRDLHSSHAHMDLTDADFMAAGGDIVKAMTNLGYGQDEIDEFVCILVSLKDQVVFN